MARSYTDVDHCPQRAVGRRIAPQQAFPGIESRCISPAKDELISPPFVPFSLSLAEAPHGRVPGRRSAGARDFNPSERAGREIWFKATAGNDNEFLYHGSDDRHGFKCPIGAHIRRTNPRDSLEPNPDSEQSIEVGKRHRILRRGRTYGAPVADSMEMLTFWRRTMPEANANCTSSASTRTSGGSSSSFRYVAEQPRLRRPL